MKEGRSGDQKNEEGISGAIEIHNILLEHDTSKVVCRASCQGVETQPGYIILESAVVACV